MKIQVTGFDPAGKNFGTATCMVDVDTLSVEVVGLSLIKTKSEKLQGVRKVSDDIRRNKEILAGMHQSCRGSVFAISEIPYFNPSSYPAALWNAGGVCMALAACTIPLIEVTPQEVKFAATGFRSGDKQEMIDWAVKTYPDAPWITVKRAGKPSLTADNEHLADAVAAVHAGLRTAQFATVLQMLRATNLKAA